MPLEIVSVPGQSPAGTQSTTTEAAASSKGLTALFAALLTQSAGLAPSGKSPGGNTPKCGTPEPPPSKGDSSSVPIPKCGTPEPALPKGNIPPFPKCGTPSPKSLDPKSLLPRCGTPNNLDGALYWGGVPVVESSESGAVDELASASASDDEQKSAPVFLQLDSTSVPLWLIPASPPPVLNALVLNPASASNAPSSGKAMDTVLLSASALRALSVAADSGLLPVLPISPNSQAPAQPGQALAPRTDTSSADGPRPNVLTSDAALARTPTPANIPKSDGTTIIGSSNTPTLTALTQNLAAPGPASSPIVTSAASSLAVAPAAAFSAAVALPAAGALTVAASPVAFSASFTAAPTLKIARKTAGEPAGKIAGEIPLQKRAAGADNRPDSPRADRQKFGEITELFLTPSQTLASPGAAKGEKAFDLAEPTTQSGAEENSAQATDTAAVGPQILTTETPKLVTANVKTEPLPTEDRARLMTQAADGIRQAHLQTTSGGHGQMTLTLHPHEWGQVQLSVTTNAGTDGKTAITAQIVASNPTVKATLEAHAPELRHALREAGLTVDHLSVTTQAAAADAATSAVRAPSGGDTLSGSFTGQNGASNGSPAWNAPSSERNSDAAATSSDFSAFGGGGQSSSFAAFAGQHGQPQNGQTPRAYQSTEWETAPAPEFGAALPAAFAAGRLDARA